MMHWKGMFPAVVVGIVAFVAGCGGGGVEADGDREVTSATVEDADFATAHFSVDGMTCGGCVLATEMAVKRVEGVRTVNATYDEDEGAGSAMVEYDVKRTDTEAIVAAVRRAGFTATLEDVLPRPGH